MKKFLNIKILSIAAFLFIGMSVSAQKYERPYNQWSLEVQTGYHLPVAPSDDVKLGDYSGAFQQFKGGIRYMVNDTYGIKAHYSFLSFENSDLPGDYKFNSVAIEGVANLWKVGNVKGDFKKTFGLLFHLGAGVTFANPSGSKGTDHVGNILGGFMPQVKLSKNFTVFADLAFQTNLKQHYAYDGGLIDRSYEHKTGGLFNFSIGLTYSFGKKDNHADWYYEK
ncbi:hypothetical protein [Aequorivita marina]|uniref:hypothetical protein n=1 Tax=Aequorivita marina TaxID=3073654 RepID=UPI0028767A1B|nr:hypothetical protein [Aequorivita sp. S2608]MDS1299044.1 hypothetical protein [Aequorivita sp. S2608]